MVVSSGRHVCAFGNERLAVFVRLRVDLDPLLFVGVDSLDGVFVFAGDVDGGVVVVMSGEFALLVHSVEHRPSVRVCLFVENRDRRVVSVPQSRLFLVHHFVTLFEFLVQSVFHVRVTPHLLRLQYCCLVNCPHVRYS